MGGGEINAIILYGLTHLNDLVSHNSYEQCDINSSTNVLFTVDVSLLAPPTGSRNAPRLNELASKFPFLLLCLLYLPLNR